MKDFAERMMRPPVINLENRDQLQKDMKREMLSAFVLCAPEVTPAFQQLAEEWQDRHRSYLATSPQTCIVDSDEPSPTLAVYTPAVRQWSARGKPTPAIAVASSTIVGSNGTELADWVQGNRFPGIWNISYENFHIIISSNRSVGLIAVQKHVRKDNDMVEQKLKQIMAPSKCSDKGPLLKYIYSSSSYFWGVMDGTLTGLDAFGVHVDRLPRVLIFEGSDAYVEDVDELTVVNLEHDLAKIPGLPRYYPGMLGYMLRIKIKVQRWWRAADRLASETGGMPLRVVAAAMMLLVSILWVALPIYIIVQLVLGVFKALNEPEAEKPKEQ